jgi:hypothetical protein
LQWALGSLAAKNAAANLLPIPIVNGGIVLMELFGVLRPEKQRLNMVLQLLGLLLILAMMAVTAVAAWIALRSI